MPLDEVPTFLKSLESYDGDQRTRLGLRLMVLTFARTTELRAARWSEFANLEGNEPLWRIPAERMKMKREHIAACTAGGCRAARIVRIARLGRQSVLVSLAVARRVHEQQYNALRAISYGLPQSCDSSRL